MSHGGRRRPEVGGGPLGFEDERVPESAPGTDAGKAPEPPPSRVGGGRFGWLVGVAAVLALAYVMLNAARTEGPGSVGVEAGRPLPPFAAPLALGGVEGDANVARKEGEGDAGHVPACEVRGAGILNICQLAERGPVVLVFLATRGGDCRRQLDVVERIRRRFAGVQFAAVSIRGDRDALRSEVRTRGWGFPVGHDRDGLVANVYGVSVCPTTTLAYPGGIVMRTEIGLQGEGALAAAVRELTQRSRARGWAPPA